MVLPGPSGRYGQKIGEEHLPSLPSKEKRFQMKRTFVPVLVLILTALLAGSAQAAEKALVLKAAHVLPEDSAFHLGLLEAARVLDQKSGGTMKIEIYSSGQLGDNRQLLEQLQTGLIDLQVNTYAVVSGSFTRAGEFFYLPFLFKDDRAVEQILDGEIGDEICAELEKINCVCLAWWTQGWRHLTTTNRAVQAPNDIKGLKIRTMDNPIFIDFFKTMGASPTPVSYSELLAALQQGVVDGQENPYMNIKQAGLYEVQKYIIETAHVYDPSPFFVSKHMWNQLNDQQKRWLKESAVEARDYMRELTRTMDAEIKAELLKNGKTVIIELTPEQKAEFRAAVEPVYQNWAPKYNGMVERIMELQK